FIHSVTPTSFYVELLFDVEYSLGSGIGTTRTHVNADTDEQLEVVVVDIDVRRPNGERASKTKVTIQRRPIA
ncbi:hypothetical protein AAVH_39578, partial [Aphelenchoides avenae]